MDGAMALAIPKEWLGLKNQRLPVPKFGRIT